jgi:hypothetical protein
MNITKRHLPGGHRVRELGSTARLAAALLFVVGSAVFSAAQQYEIMRADYGVGSQRRDVTSAFRQAVCSQTRFRMGNSTFGFDPSPGNKKSLRVYVRAGRAGSRRCRNFRRAARSTGRSICAGAVAAGTGLRRCLGLQIEGSGRSCTRRTGQSAEMWM